MGLTLATEGPNYPVRFEEISDEFSFPPAAPRRAAPSSSSSPTTPAVTDSDRIATRAPAGANAAGAQAGLVSPQGAR